MTPDLFVRKLCHDIRAPLRALTELPCWLEEDLADQRVHWPESANEYLEMMKTQAARLNDLVEGMSHLVKIARSEATPVTDVEAALGGTTWPEGVRCVLEGTPRVFPIEEEHFTIVLEQLVGNAIKHADDARCEVTVTVLCSGTQHAIRVTDNGPGIPEAYRAKVFEPLCTLKSRDQCEGSGLGLSMVAKIAELYDGACAIDTNPDGVGVTVSLTVPAGAPGDRDGPKMPSVRGISFPSD